MKDVHKQLAKSILIPLGLATAASAADTGIHKKIVGFRNHNIGNFKRKNRRYYENS